jgi:hypothetical protein
MGLQGVRRGQPQQEPRQQRQQITTWRLLVPAALTPRRRCMVDAPGPDMMPHAGVGAERRKKDQVLYAAGYQAE